jgi:preprotein translocase subunit SecG
MVTVILIVHLFIAMAMIGLILLQKTEGNAAGGGFSASANMSSMMQPRARPNALGRATAILGIAFFATSLGLALIAKQTGPVRSVLDTPAAATGDAPKVNEIRGEEPAAPAAPPAAEAPAPAAPAAPAVPTVPNN